MSHATVSRWLDGTLLPTVDQTKALADSLGITGQARADLLQVAEWVNPNRGTRGLFGISDRAADALKVEHRATAIVEWSPLRIPDLLQTDAYARRVTDETSGVTSKAERQKALFEDTRKKYEVFLGLPALTWRVGGANVMTQQVERLIDTLDRQSAVVRLVPDGSDWHDGRLGGFVLYDREDDDGAVLIQHLGAATVLTDRELVRRYRRVQAELEQLALTAEETRQRLDALLRELSTA
ncbi:transcriptional regulator [Amycolatopsis deserti]|uniref:Transcriptional regulator n=1 Tax=Amycolatopsis deserti TaxID=185696 RepID=A0ABQ3IEV1_9PSEU|nr:DUF5753 domain-containing protein [Amycolatopsis deserti]GHE81003.1 transcriptional regulator [Amycolatopsis deserti]